MTPEEITALFATAATSIALIAGQPTDDDLTRLRDVLYPLLLDIPYDETEDGHNLIGLIEPTTIYTTRWGAAFPIPVRLPAYPAIADDASAVVRARSEANHTILVRTHPTTWPNVLSPSSYERLLMKSGTATSATHSHTTSP